MSDAPQKEEPQNDFVPKHKFEEGLVLAPKDTHDDVAFDEKATPTTKRRATEDVAKDPSQDPPSEVPVTRVFSGEEYSVLTPAQKKMVIVTASVASLFSPMATAIYCEFSLPAGC